MHITRIVTPLLLFSAVVGAGCARHSSDEETDQTPKAVVHVHAATLRKGDVDVRIPVTGRNDAIRKEKILSPIAGKVVSLHGLEGGYVEAGDVICTILPKEADAALEGARVFMRDARTPGQKQDAERMLTLADSGRRGVSIRSRFNAVVASRNVTEGQYVSDQTELFTLVDLSSLVFIANLPLSALQAVHLRQQAWIRFPLLSSELFPATVDAIHPQVDIQNQTALVRLRFTGLTPIQRRLLKIDMMGTASIAIGRRMGVLLAPRSALLRDDENDTYTIVTITPDSLARSLPVTVGVLTDSTAEVEGAGLFVSMPVITTGNYALPDSTRVTVERP